VGHSDQPRRVRRQSIRTVKVLVIEDEKKINSLIRKGLEPQGFIVDSAQTGDEGYALATTRPYDAIVLGNHPGRWLSHPPARMKAISFRLKIALLSTLISGTVLVAFGLASWYLLYRQKLQALDTEIRSLGTRHPGWLANGANFDRLNASLEFISIRGQGGGRGYGPGRGFGHRGVGHDDKQHWAGNPGG
jgi:hypothetical protein